MKLLLAGLVMLLAALALWGTGVFFRRCLGERNPARLNSIGVGLAVVVLAGGILNLCRLACGPALWALAAICLALGVLELKRARPQLTLPRAAWVEFGAAALAIIAALVFAMVTQLPPRVFNAADDFQKYFAHPVRMLETGTLLGSPMGGLGSQTLGGQAFLQGFALSALPIGYINAVDAVFGFLVLMVLAASAGWRRFGAFPGALLGPLLIAVINPQYVNVSGLYLGAVLMATSVLLVAGEPDDPPPSPITLGLVYAALLALKSSFAPFVLFHFPLSALAVRCRVNSWKAACDWAARVAVLAVVCVAPWFVLQLPNFLGAGIFGNDTVPDGDDGQLNLFSARPVYYGASFAHYTFVAVLAGISAVCAAVSMLLAADRRRAVSAAVAAAGGTGALCYVLLLVVMGPRWSGYAPSLRYSIPFALGAGVFAILLFPTLPLRLPRLVAIGAPVLAAFAVIVAFMPSFAARCRQAVASGSVLAFSTMAEFPTYVRYSEFVLSGEAEKHIRAIQDQVPPGEPMFAWVSTSFLLDYRRNPVADFEPGGVATPWARVPANVRYVLWQYRGFKGFEEFGVTGIKDYVEQSHGPGKLDRRIAARSLLFLQHLKDLSAAGKMIANDGEFVLFQLPDAAATNHP